MSKKSCTAFIVVLFLAAVCLAVSPASASELIDRDARNIVLQVNERGEALVSYVSHGKERYVLVWGAMNAIAPTRSSRQVEFEKDYSGGWQKYYLDDPKVKVLRTKYQQLKNSGQPYLNSPIVKELSAKSSFARNYWKDSFNGSCAKYDGPKLAWFVTACRAPDGSYWAVQSWQRGLPNYGQESTSLQNAWELRLSHWTGELPELIIKLDWSYRRFDHLYGSFTYSGRGVYGFRVAPSGAPLDGFGRNIYLDTYNSVYGPGWRRENSFLTHRPNGTFCYGFYSHGTRGQFPPGKGKRYRATVIGPGVIPDVSWEGPTPGPYDREADLADLDRQRNFLTGDRVCQPL